MTIDLIVLGVVGFISELIGIYINGFLIPWTTPVFVVSILMIVLAITRWNGWGLLIVPSQALATFVAGRFLLGDILYKDGSSLSRAQFYKMETFLVIMLSYFACGITYFILKFLKNKFAGDNKVLYRQLLLMINCLCVIFTQLLMLNVFSFLIDSTVTAWMINNLVSNVMLGIAITFILGNLLYHQKIFINQKYLLISQKNNREDKYYNNYIYGNQNEKIDD